LVAVAEKKGGGSSGKLTVKASLGKISKPAKV
jgi:hypothetical protein